MNRKKLLFSGGIGFITALFVIIIMLIGSNISNELWNKSRYITFL